MVYDSLYCWQADWPVGLRQVSAHLVCCIQEPEVGENSERSANSAHSQACSYTPPLQHSFQETFKLTRMLYRLFTQSNTKFLIFYFLICLRWAGPWPHIPFPSRPHFVCKFSRHGDNLSVLRPGFPSIKVLVLPDFADAYSHTTASYSLAQLSGQIPESSQFLGASKLPLLEWTCLNAGTTMHTNSVSLTPQFM
jgi:hypothetical protein